MRRLPLLLPLLFASCAGSPTSHFDTRPWTFEARGPRWIVRCDTTQEEADAYLRFLDAQFDMIARVLDLDPESVPVPGPIRVALFRDRDEFLSLAASSTEAAFYRPAVREVVGYRGNVIGKAAMAHEATHAFMDLLPPGVAALPPWFAEGMAEVLATFEIGEPGPTICSLAGSATKARLARLQSTLKTRPLPPLREVTAASWAEVDYPLSWSFCHFLLCAPALDAGTGPQPPGIHRARLLDFYRRLRAGTDSRRAWAEAFEGISHEDLEAQWRAHAGQLLKVSATFEAGFCGGLLLIEHREPDRSEGAAWVLGPSGAGDELLKAGIQRGDLIIGCGTDRFSPGRAVTDLTRRWEALEPGSRILVVVLRKGRLLEIAAEKGR